MSFSLFFTLLMLPSLLRLGTPASETAFLSKAAGETKLQSVA
jgi:hypothetical protein